jgi:ATP phosphoribosyltransferase regulatory subunit
MTPAATEMVHLDRYSARWLEARRARTRVIMDVFTGAGCDTVSPPHIQPANLLLDVVGESVGETTYLCEDRHGADLCLRTDLTVPTCLFYLRREPEASRAAKYAAAGTVFRQPSMDAKASEDGFDHGELHQVGIEIFNGRDAIAADVEVLDLVLDGLRRSELRSSRVRIGDVAIFRDLVAGLPMPERWRQQLVHHFWHPRAFAAYLNRLTKKQPLRVPAALAKSLDANDLAASTGAVQRYLDKAGTELQGDRSVAEVTAGLLDQLRDAAEAPLAFTVAGIIDSYLHIEARPDEALAQIRELAKRQPGLDLSASLDAFQQRLTRLVDKGIRTADLTFDADFGRDFEYYTGFVFEVTAGPAHAVTGARRTIAGGGRYDSLCQALGSSRRVPAVGAAIYTDRLLAAAWGSGL